MIRYLHRDPKFDSCLEELRRRGGTAEAAARKVDGIIERIVERGNLGIDGIAKVTRNGEHRIRNCCKYILGGGYRLICVSQDGHLMLLFAGNHEECHRWIESNKGLTYHAFHELDGGIPTGISESALSVPSKQWTEADEYEARLMSQLDDSLLRKIFCGLCGEAPHAQTR